MTSLRSLRQMLSYTNGYTSSTWGYHLNIYIGILNRKPDMFIGRIYRDLFNQVYYLQLRSLSHTTLLLYMATLFPNQFKIYSLQFTQHIKLLFIEKNEIFHYRTVVHTLYSWKASSYFKTLMLERFDLWRSKLSLMYLKFWLVFLLFCFYHYI